MAESPRFENSASGAASGNPNLVRQGNQAGIAQQQNATAAREDLGQAPPKAPAATQSSQLQSFSGLATALNKWQQEQVKLGKYSKADEYVIEFAPPQLGATKMKRPGSTSDDSTAMQAPTGTGKDLNPATNSRNTNSRTFSVEAGTIITQVIDMIMQNSDYVSAQALYYIDENTGKTLPNTPNNNGQTAWYKITTHTELLGPDPGRNSNAYRFTYIITPYGLSNAQSEYFNNSAFRGVHKNYDYWFTGKNTQVLQYEQEINNAYTLVLSGVNANFQKQGLTSDFREKYIKAAMTRSGQSDHGAKNGANEIAANLADFLYSSGDLANIRIKIMGDPAWLFQGEVANSATKQNFTFRPFLPDGTINADASQALFTVSWNRPADYDYNKGTAPVNANNKNIDNESFPQETLTYTAYRCVSSFKQGMFTQELYGSQLTDYNKPEDTAPNRAAPAANPSASRKPTTAEKGQQLLNDYAKDVLKVPTALLPTPNTKPTIADNPAVRNQLGLDINQGSAPPLTNQPAPTTATSNGDITPTNTNVNAPQNVKAASSTDNIALNTQTAAEDAYYRAGSPQSGPIYDAYIAALDATDKVQTQLENANYNTTGLNYKPAPLIVNSENGRIMGTVPQSTVRET